MPVPLKIIKRKLMGASIRLSVDHPNADQILSQSIDFLKTFEKTFSANDCQADLARVNAGAHNQAMPVPEELFYLIQRGRQESLDPQSYLNIAIGPLVQLWRIGFKEARRPSEQEIQTRLPLIQAKDILLDDNRKSVQFKKKGMAIDLGALAKGYAADLLKARLEKENVQAGLIDLGGNILCFGHNPNHTLGQWRIGIQEPFTERGKNRKILTIDEGSVVTSGIYVRRLQIQGESYHHILDSRTGYPIKSQMSSITILSPLSLDGELWTSRLFGKTPQEAIEEINSQPGLEAAVISKDGQLFLSDNL